MELRLVPPVCLTRYQNSEVAPSSQHEVDILIVPLSAHKLQGQAGNRCVSGGIQQALAVVLFCPLIELRWDTF